MTKIKAREIEIPDFDGLDPLGHNVCLKVVPECQDPCGPHEPYQRGEVVNLVICERGWAEEDHEPVPVTKHELGQLIAELQRLHSEMAGGDER